MGLVTEPRKPIFGFLWAKPDPDAPLDAAYQQTRRVRVTPRGPLRLAVLVVGTLLVAIGAGSAILAGLSTGSLAAAFVASAVVGLALVLVLRGWVLGTYVTDTAVTIERAFVRVTVPWTEIVSVDVLDGRRGFLGLPIRTRARCCNLRLADGSHEPTHIYSTSPDLWLRPEAFDMAALRLERWK